MLLCECVHFRCAFLLVPQIHAGHNVHMNRRFFFLAIFLSGFFSIPPPLSPAEASGDEKFPPELTKFVPYDKNPTFTAGGKGKWDERIRERGWIMRDGGSYKMWYTGYTGKPDEILKLGYATSPDGIAWKRF